VSGKYKVLKERLKKSIVHLCEKYFVEQTNGLKSFSGVSCSPKDQFYSQVYAFLVANYKQTLKDIVFEKQELLNEVEVLSVQSQRNKVEKLLEAYSKETTVERVRRVLWEYEQLGQFDYLLQIFKTYMDA